jgi:hypothetical protein
MSHVVNYILIFSLPPIFLSKKKALIACIASIFGFLVGGFSSRLVENYEDFNNNGFLIKFPYFVVNIIPVSILALSLLTFLFITQGQTLNLTLENVSSENNDIKRLCDEESKNSVVMKPTKTSKRNCDETFNNKSLNNNFSFFLYYLFFCKNDSKNDSCSNQID